MTEKVQGMDKLKGMKCIGWMSARWRDAAVCFLLFPALSLLAVVGVDNPLLPQDDMAAQWDRMGRAVPAVLAYVCFLLWIARNCRSLHGRMSEVLSWAVMLAAGIPLTEALEVSGQMAGSRRLKQELFRLREEVCRGLSLSQAMEAGGGTFPPLLVYMVRAGEAGGGLDGILKRMAEYYERQRELNGRIRTAMSYPMILLAVTAFVCIFLVSEVLPQFTSLLEGQPLPWLTRIFLGMGDYLANHGSVLLLSVLVLTILTAGIFKISSVRLAADRVLLYIPIVGKLLKTIDAARFAQTFGIVYGSGAGILEALELAGQVMGNTYIQKAIESLEEEIQRGSLLSRSLQREDIFPPVFVSGSMVLSVMTPVFQMYSSML